MKKIIIVLIILAIGGVVALRATQVISSRKTEDPRGQGMRQAPLVEVAPVTRGLIEETVSRVGDIAPEAQVTIYSKVQGWVEKIHVREGDHVHSGQILATLDAREAEAAVAQSQANLEAAVARLKQVQSTSEETVQSQIQQTRANLDLAESDLKRAQDLHEKNFIARQQLDEAQTRYNVARAAYSLALNSLQQKTWENDIALAAAQMRQAKANLDLTQAQLANLIILSPMNGGVSKRYVDPGTMVKDTTPLLTLVDLSQVKMMVNVIEKEYVNLRQGQLVQITVAAFPQRTFQGRISAIPPALDLQSRTAEIQITIPNPDYLLNPGMFGQAKIVIRSNAGARLAPIQAVVSRGDQDFVFVVRGGKAYRRLVQKGLTRDTFVEIIKGLTFGEQVVTAGQELLQDGAPIRQVEKAQKAEG